MNDIIVRSITRIVIPFVMLYGIYIVLHGHISPGGGFSGGALVGSSLILYTLVFGVDKARKKFSHRVSEIAESGGILLYLFVGALGIILSGSFLSNQSAGFPMGELGSLLSGGVIPILMIVIGIKVASTMISLFHILIEEEK